MPQVRANKTYQTKCAPAHQLCAPLVIKTPLSVTKNKIYSRIMHCRKWKTSFIKCYYIHIYAFTIKASKAFKLHIYNYMWDWTHDIGSITLDKIINRNIYFFTFKVFIPIKNCCWWQSCVMQYCTQCIFVCLVRVFSY